RPDIHVSADVADSAGSIAAGRNGQVCCPIAPEQGPQAGDSRPVRIRVIRIPARGTMRREIIVNGHGTAGRPGRNDIKRAVGVNTESDQARIVVLRARGPDIALGPETFEVGSEPRVDFLVVESGYLVAPAAPKIVAFGGTIPQARRCGGLPKRRDAASRRQAAIQIPAAGATPGHRVVVVAPVDIVQTSGGSQIPRLARPHTAVDGSRGTTLRIPADTIVVPAETTHIAQKRARRGGHRCTPIVVHSQDEVAFSQRTETAPGVTTGK